MPSRWVPDSMNGAPVNRHVFYDRHSSSAHPPQENTSTRSDDVMSLKRDREREGRCADCGIQTHKVIFLDSNAPSMVPTSTKEPLTIENEVLRGRCLLCHPLPNATAHQYQAVQAATRSKTYIPDKVESANPTGPENVASSFFHETSGVMAHKYPAIFTSPPPNQALETTLAATSTYVSAEEALNNTNFDSIDICDIISIMRRFPSNSIIQEKGCKQLWIQSYDDDTSIAIGRVGGISTVVDAMRYHTHNATLQQYACEALQNLASCNNYNRDVVADMGGIAAITDAMRLHRYVMGVQTRGCAALANIATGSMDNKVNVAECGGVDAVVHAVEAFPGEEKVVLAAYQVLRVLGYNFQHRYGLGGDVVLEYDNEMEE